MSSLPEYQQHRPEPEPTAVGSAYPTPWAPDSPVPPRRRPARAVLAGLATALALTALGAPLGLLWAGVAPGVPVAQSAGGPVLRESQPEQFIAADGWFSVLGLGYGVLAAVGVWWVLRRHRGAVALVALTFGTVGAALVAWQLGRHIGLGDYERWRAGAAVGETFLRPADLRAGGVRLLWGFLPSVRGDLLVPAFGAAVTYTLLAGWASDPELGVAPQPPAEPASPLSWGSPDQPAPTGAPAPPAPGAAGPPPG